MICEADGNHAFSSGEDGETPQAGFKKCIQPTWNAAAAKNANTMGKI